MVINTNTAAMVAQAAQAKTNKAMDTAMERLSTGQRINSAADDAAGLAISSRMESQIRGMAMAMKNAGDAQSLVDTAEGAHDEIENILQRMRELAVQAANDTNVAGDRLNLQAEVDSLVSEIDRIATQTTWNGMSLLDNTFSTKKMQIGAEGNQTLQFSIDGVKSTMIGSFTEYSDHKIAGDTAGNAGTTAVTGDVTATDLTVTGHVGSNSSALSVTAGMSAKDIAALVNGVSTSTGVEATAVTKAKIDTNSANGAISFKINGTAIASTSNTTGDLRNMRDAINAAAATTGVTAAVSASTNAELILTAADGRDIQITHYDHAVADATLNVYALDRNEANATAAVTFDNDDDGTQAAQLNAATITGQVSMTSTHDFTISGTSASVYATSEDADLAAVSTVDIGTQNGANTAIAIIDGALERIGSARADFGAISNRIDHTINNLTNIKVNVEASQSRIADADFATETSNLTKAQILSQAATAMLAQANASKQSVLSLLQA